MSLTIVIIAITGVVSYICFNNRDLFYKLSLNPYDIFRKNQWYRLVTHGFIHANLTHLFINMFVLYSFGNFVESVLNSITNNGELSFIAYYLGALIFSSLYDLITKKNNYLYNSIGASGAVSATIFTSILVSPWNNIYFMAIIPIPSIVFGVLYLWYEQYMSKRGGGNVNHKAHIWGAAWGIIFPILLNPALLAHFLRELMSFSL